MNIPGITLATQFGRYVYDHSPSVTNVSRNINKIAVFAVTTYAVCTVPIADGGPVTWAACILVCETAAAAATVATAGAAAAALVACAEGCWPLLAPFCP